MSDRVYLVANRVDVDATYYQTVEYETDPSPYPAPNNLAAAGAVPRVGDYFRADHRWWRVDVVVWSQFANCIVPEVARTQDWIAWVDLGVTLMPEDWSPWP